MLGARECPIVVWGNVEQCSSSFEGLVATVTSWLCGSNKSTGTLTFMLGSPKECGPRGLRVALSPWPFLSGILSVDAPLRNFSRGLLIGSHCSGAFLTAHQQHHRRRRILAITMVGIPRLSDRFVTFKSKYPACQSPSLPGSRVASSCWEATSTIAITTMLLTLLSSPSLLKTSFCH